MFDLVFLDILMEGTDGMQAAAEAARGRGPYKDRFVTSAPTLCSRAEVERCAT